MNTCYANDRKAHRLGLALLCAMAAAAGACTGDVTTGFGDSEGDSKHMKGAGGRSVAEYWPSIDIPMSQNTRMLSFEMLRSEVQRATGLDWALGGVSQWEPNRAALGGADYVSTFADDLTPSQQRIVLLRKMAFTVCGDLVAQEGGSETREVFDVLDPADPASVTSADADSQIASLHYRFFLEEAEEIDIAESKELLSVLSAEGGSEAAWRGVCASFLGSMRFLSY